MQEFSYFKYKVHFLYLSKENEPAAKRRKKRQPFTCSACSGIPCAAHKERTLRKVAEFIPPCGVLRRIVFPLFIALLGCVKWHFKKHYSFV